MNQQTTSKLPQTLDQMLAAMTEMSRSRGNTSWLPAIVLMALWGMSETREPLKFDESIWTFIEQLIARTIKAQVPPQLGDRLTTTIRSVDEPTLRNWLGCLRNLSISPGDLPALSQWVGSVLDNAEMWANKGTAPLGLGVPQSLSHLAVSLANPLPGSRIYDPACGTGAFLAAAAQILTSRRGSSYSALVGYDLHEEALAITWLRLHLAAQRLEPSSGTPGQDKADIILCAPPAGIQSKHIHAPWAHHRYRFDSSPRLLSETAITAMSFECLNSGGRAVLLIPKGLLSRPGEDRLLRKYLFETQAVEAVISLPAGVLAPLTHIPTALLILSKSPKPSDTVTMIDASDIGLKDRRRIILRPEDCDAVIAAFRTKGSGQEDLHVRAVTWDVIARNDQDLLPERYIVREVESHRRPDKDRLDDLKALEARYRELADETDALIEKLVGSSPSAP